MRRGALYLVSFLLLLGWSARADARCPFHQPIALARAGDGWTIPPTWANRGLNYGTPSMIGLIQRAAKRVASKHPGATLGVADISRRKGGKSEWHKSHTCGRDVDFLFYAVDTRGRPLPALSSMIPFNARGVGVHRGAEVKFDTARNWALIKALLQDRVSVEKVFIHDSLKRRLLAHAKKRKESPALIARADARMVQPSDAGPHDDHLHVRISLTRADLTPPPKVAAARLAVVTTRRAAEGMRPKPTRTPRPRTARG